MNYVIDTNGDTWTVVDPTVNDLRVIIGDINDRTKSNGGNNIFLLDDELVDAARVIIQQLDYKK